METHRPHVTSSAAVPFAMPSARRIAGDAVFIEPDRKPLFHAHTAASPALESSGAEKPPSMTTRLLGSALPSKTAPSSSREDATELFFETRDGKPGSAIGARS